uniref:Zona pellucida sperm-binding protein 3 n=1 Tax=Scleropages formosus TaxID=113540 RepID=A0A8C9RYH7_SCLFO
WTGSLERLHSATPNSSPIRMQPPAIRSLKKTFLFDSKSGSSRRIFSPVECREDSVLVEVQQDMLSNGQMIQPSEITLGGCVPVGQDPSRGVLLFVSELHGCGSTLTVTDSLIYTFTLVYVPEGLGSTPIVRSHGAVINVECHYLRRLNVSSNAVMPTWVPYSAGSCLFFSLDNWELERASNIYFLGDVLNIEASVVVANHQPLRVFVDSCVATLEPDVTSVPRYAFVGNYGCLTDAKVTGSRSQFLPRKQINKLQMQLDAFRFSQETRSSIYITCVLKATMASKRADPQHKACSYSVWGSADGDDQVCGCCDSSCNSCRETGTECRAVTASALRCLSSSPRVFQGRL